MKSDWVKIPEKQVDYNLKIIKKILIYIIRNKQPKYIFYEKFKSSLLIISTLDQGSGSGAGALRSHVFPGAGAGALIFPIFQFSFSFLI